MRNPTSVAFRLAGAASILTLSGLITTSPVQAASSTSHSDAIKHIIECAEWLISDPAKHAEFCGPGHTVFVSGSTGYGCPEYSSCYPY